MPFQRPRACRPRLADVDCRRAGRSRAKEPKRRKYWSGEVAEWLKAAVCFRRSPRHQPSNQERIS